MNAKPLEHKPIKLPTIPAETTEAEQQRFDKSLGDIFGPMESDHYAKMQLRREADWHDIARAFEESPDLFNSYRFIDHHPVFWYLRTHPATPLVKPVFHEKNLEHSDGIRSGFEVTVMRTKDTASGIVIWCEFGLTHRWKKADGTGQRLHDYRLDSGGATYELAVIKAAKRLHDIYGNDRRGLKGVS
jgi:hypothetical protein